MKTFAVVAIACFAVFVGTAIYLLVGGEGAHVAKPALPAEPPATAPGTAPSKNASAKQPHHPAPMGKP